MKNETQIKPLDSQTRTNITTEEAAYYLSRKPQTLRIWACSGKGPIQPVRIGGRLSWKTAEIKQLLQG